MDTLGAPFSLNFYTADLLIYLPLTIAVLGELAVFLGVLLLRSPLLKMPGFVISFLIFVFFGLPSLLFSRTISDGLVSPGLFFFSIHLPIIMLLFNARFFETKQNEHVLAGDQSGFSPFCLGALLTLLVFFVLVYFQKVPYDCTALYAILFDPYLSLLAREFGLKIIGTSAATYAFGAIANTIAPVLITIALIEILKFKRLSLIPVWIVLVIICFLSIMIGGVKGLLAPTLFVSSISLLFYTSKVSGKLVSAILPLLLLIGLITSFDFFIQRGGDVGKRYNVGACSARLGLCDQTRVLLASMMSRDMTLGLPNNFTKRISESLECHCSSNKSGSACVKRSSGLFLAGALEGKLVEEKWVVVESKLMAVLRRALIVPIQVASWHFGYAEHVGRLGWEAMPFSRRISGHYVNAAEVVYQKYGVIYSGGDKTSSSTAPTGFFLAYPAYVGVSGLAIALMLFLGTSVLFSLMLSKMNRLYRCISLGLVAAFTMNLIFSDYVTVLLSHGGLVTLLLMAGFIFDSNRKGKAEQRSREN